MARTTRKTELQINNLSIRFSVELGKWRIQTLKGVAVNAFLLLADAKKWARSNPFTAAGNPKRL